MQQSDNSQQNNQSQNNNSQNNQSGQFEQQNQSNSQQGDNNKNVLFQSMPLRDYYDGTVTEVLLQGLREIGKQRPENPIQFLGRFLLDNDPENK